MMKSAISNKASNYALVSLISGAISALIFMVAHDIFISSIWFLAPLAIAAGSLCGFCVAWSYGLIPVNNSFPVILLGLNLSVLGFIVIPLSAISMVAEFFTYIVLLNVVFAMTFILLRLLI